MKRPIVVLAALVVISTAAFATSQHGDIFAKTYKPKKDTALGKAGCVICHTKPGAAALNPYGTALKGKPLTADSLKSIEKLDSDRDGISNIDEISAGTLPGDPKSKPQVADTDPVCKMKVDKTKEPAGGMSTYKGITYYFCNKACKEAFDKNPAKYVRT